VNEHKELAMAKSTLSVEKLSFRKATKKKPIKAKPVVEVIDPNVVEHFEVVTPEGREKVDPDAELCRGEGGEVWQQTTDKLDEKYSPTVETDDGWTMYKPKEHNEANAVQVVDQPDGFAIKGLWGEEQPDGSKLQFGDNGDYVLQSVTDPADVWIVKQALFESTYAWTETQAAT
jgi:hypothetical protein